MQSQPATVVAALAAAVQREPGRPFVTMYDDAAGERVELSFITFDNWVCKLANLFSLEWDLAGGELVRIAMPAGWHGAVTVVAAWTAGLVVTQDPDLAAVRDLRSWRDFAADVPAQPDTIVLPSRVAAGDVALLGAGGTSTHADLVNRGQAAADNLGLAPGGRLLTDLNATDPVGIEVALVAPLITGSSVVLLLNANVERRERVASQERVTCSRWVGH